MEFCQVKLEGHERSMTIYIVGFLADFAAARTEVIVGQFRDGTSVVRVDLRGVEIIDPTAFVRHASSHRIESTSVQHRRYIRRSARARRVALLI
jgi:hypothetical protein